MKTNEKVRTPTEGQAARAAKRVTGTIDSAGQLADHARSSVAERLDQIHAMDRPDMHLDRVRDLAREGLGRLSHLDLAERLPDPIREKVQPRRRNRWRTIALLIAGMAVVCGGLAYAWRRIRSQYWLERQEPPLAEPLSYPAADTSRDEPATAPEHIEIYRAPEAYVPPAETPFEPGEVYPAGRNVAARPVGSYWELAGERGDALLDWPSETAVPPAPVMPPSPRPYPTWPALSSDDQFIISILGTSADQGESGSLRPDLSIAE